MVHEFELGLTGAVDLKHKVGQGAAANLGSLTFTP